MQSGNAVFWFVDRHVREGRAERLAFRDPWRSVTYGELAVETARFAGALQRAGVGREQRVVLLLQDTIDFPIAFWGTMRAGAVPVPVNTLLTAETVGTILADCRA
ncbi:MAG TPA: AMP-binding protein, partial [Rhodopila sp.]|nr:AMP-binding protein [Rhodopila sp.]